MPAKGRAKSPPPAGTVTFLFTDIEGSTVMWEAHPRVMRTSLERHDALLRAIITGAGGYVFKTVGDAFCAAFARAADAVGAALQAQAAIAAEPWPGETPIKVRMAVHTGAVDSRDGDYFGPPVNRVARLLSAGHGGQTLLSQAAWEGSRDGLPQDASLRDLGLHRLKDLARPEHVFELSHPRLRSDFPAIRSLSTHPNNLPQQLTTFIGRAREVSEVTALLAGNRLLTLTGAGGSGKTRLGVQVAAESLAQFPDGVWLTELAPITEPDLVAQAMAAALGVKEQRGRPLAQTLADSLKDKRALILLDNCEHVLNASAAIADALLRECAGVRILATSREPLGIAGEQTYRVPILQAFESVQLFADRAALARPNFALTDRNASAVAAICSKLDGVPLAIELAAARVSSLSVEEIHDRLDRRFGLLTRGSRTALPRHQTLRALIDWSYDLLGQAERALLRSLAVFSGGWTLEAAEATCAGGTVAGDVVDLLTSLSNKSLTVWDQGDGRSRYRLLDTLRQYAGEKLTESGDEQRIRDRHRDYHLALAERSLPKLTGTEQAEWLRRLEDEHDNFRSALEWCVAGSTEEGFRLCAALLRFWVVRGHFSEGRAWCERLLHKPGSQRRTKGRAKALHTAGALAYYQGDYLHARTALEEGLSILQEIDDRTGVAAALNALGNVAIEQGDYALARTRHEASLAKSREVGEPGDIANSLVNLGVVAEKQGDQPAARTLYEEALAIRRRVGDRWGIAVALNNLANVAFEQGNYAATRSLLEEGLAIRRELGDRRGIALSLGNLAELANTQGDAVSARAWAVESLAIGRELGDGRQICHALDRLGEVHAALGSVLIAARVWGAAQRLREAMGSADESVEHDPRAIAARARLADDAAFDAAWQDGRGLTLEQAAALATEDPVAQR